MLAISSTQLAASWKRRSLHTFAARCLLVWHTCTPLARSALEVSTALLKKQMSSQPVLVAERLADKVLADLAWLAAFEPVIAD